MDALFNELLAWIGANPGWAYLIIFLVALAESIAIVGMIVPGVMIMIGAGALIAAGSLAFWPTALAAIAGAIMGDGLSYWLGHHYREHIRTRWPFSRFPKQLDQGIAFFERYGGKSVAFGRFFGPGRAVIPLVAGMMQMPPQRFAIANISSAAAWGPAYLAPGIVFGASLKLAAEATARLAILLFILIGLVWAAVWLTRQLFWLLSPYAAAWLQSLLRWANVHPKVGRIAQALADSDHPDAPALAALAVALLGAAAIVGLSVSAGLLGEQEILINQIALDLGQSLHTPLADQLMAGLARLGEPSVTVSIVVSIVIYLLAQGRQREIGYWLAAFGFALVATPTLGWLLEIPRPALGLDLKWPWSFPSGQVLTATLVYGFFAISLARGLARRWRWIPYATATVLVAAVAAARLYFGTEWLTDIVGSIALGLTWIAALGLAYRRHTNVRPEWLGLTLVAVLSAGAAFVVSTLERQHADVAAHQPERPVTGLSAEAWRTRENVPVARHREDLWHRNQRPFDIQYAGRLRALRETLAGVDWHPAEMLSWRNAIKLLSPSLPLQSLPVIPHVHDGHYEDLTLVKDTGNGRRFVLRLWATGYRIDGTIPLWVGDVTELRKDVILDLFALPITVPDQTLGGTTLETDIGKSAAIELAAGIPLLLSPNTSDLLPHPSSRKGSAEK